MKVTLTLPASLKTMLEDLAKMEREGVDAVAREMLEAGAEVALEGMRRRVPVKTGKLKSHLRRSAIKCDGNRVYTKVGIIGAPAEVVRYGTAQEYGTSRHGAQSYVRSTMKEDRAKIYRAMRNVLKQRLGGN